MIDSVQQEDLRGSLHRLGFDVVRFAALEPTPVPDEALRAWLAAGHHAEMAWMERGLEKRENPALVQPGTQSIIMLGVNYWADAFRAPAMTPSDRPRWARYALHADYHDTMKAGLEAAGRVLEASFGLSAREYRYYVDTGPVVERGWAQRAGLGFVGKNAMLISRDYGNWLFLAAILVPLRFRTDPPVTTRLNPGGDVPRRQVGRLCGSCTRCLDACPTQAFAAPGVVNSRLCISYQTIENRGIIPKELRPAIGSRIYGCDVCLEVCPWNRFAQESRRLLLSAREDLTSLELSEILQLTPERFAEVFRKTAIKRIKLTGLLRNACIVAGNTGDARYIPFLVPLARHDSEIVRAHAVWALRRLGAVEEVRRLRRGENHPLVLVEYTPEDEGRSEP